MATTAAKTYKKGPEVASSTPETECEVFIVSMWWEGKDSYDNGTSLEDALADLMSDDKLAGFEIHRAV